MGGTQGLRYGRTYPAHLHVFDGLEQVHHQMEEQALEKAMLEIDYHAIRTLAYMLPNGKKLVQIDFEK